MYISNDMNHEYTSETYGKKSDYKCLSDDRWLTNTEVKFHLQKKKGLWHLTMVFICIESLIKIRCRSIDSYTSKKKAITFAKILQRGIRKDARGTLKKTKHAFNICYN